MRLLTLPRTALVLLLASLAGLALWAAQASRAPAVTERLRCELPAPPKGSTHPDMAWVPAGRYVQGDDIYREEEPQRPVEVAGFWMDRTEVTNAQFAAFVQATGHVTTAERAVDATAHPELPPELRQPGAVVFVAPDKVDGTTDVRQWWRFIPGANWRHPGGPGTSIEGREAFPVVAITLADAEAYARWKGRSLPTEAEWEWAARAASPSRPPPQQEHAQPEQANTWQGPFPVKNSGADGFLGLAPVGCYAPNALGLFDLIGNVWELTVDLYRPGHFEASSPPPDQLPAALQRGQSTVRVIKGGSFLCAPDYCMRYRAGARQPQEEDLATSHLGFRTVLRVAAP